MAVTNGPRRSVWLTWLIVLIAVVATTALTGVIMQQINFTHQTKCGRQAADRDRNALVAEQRTELERLQHPTKHVVADLEAAIKNYLATVSSDDPKRYSC